MYYTCTLDISYIHTCVIYDVKYMAVILLLLSFHGPINHNYGKYVRVQSEFPQTGSLNWSNGFDLQLWLGQANHSTREAAPSVTRRLAVVMATTAKIILAGMNLISKQHYITMTS